MGSNIVMATNSNSMQQQVSRNTSTISNISSSVVNKMLVTSTAATNRLLVTSVTVDDTKILKQIQASHAHDAQQVDVKPVLDLIEAIFHHASLSTHPDLTAPIEDLVDVLGAKMGGGTTAGPQGVVLDALSSTIQKVCCEFSCKCTAGDAHASAMAIFDMLGNYSWDAKVVIALAAFAVTYGQLWLVLLFSNSNPLAHSLALLKQTPDISEINSILKPRFEPINELIRIMVDVAKSLIEFGQLPSKYISPDDPPLATSINEVAMAAYWTIRSIVASGAQITANFGAGVTTSAKEAWDLSSLAHKVKSLHDHLVRRLHICYEFIEQKKMEEAYTYLGSLFKMVHKDNLRILKALIYAKDDIHPLSKITNKMELKVQVEILRSKTVLFFISDLDVSEEELTVLDKVYRESRKNESQYPYEIVWLPIVDRNVTWTNELEKRFQELKNRMSWYTLFHPSLLSVTSIRFVREEWGFVKKPIVVSLDPVGKLVCQNAYHMLLIWGNLAYPFSTEREETLWSQQTWKLEFLLQGIHPEFPTWIGQEDTHICLFGGEDIDWIRKFTSSMKDYAVKIGVKFELVYIGKHNAKEAVKKIIEVINSERLAHTLPDLTQVWYFWSRLESMMYSRISFGKNVTNDTIFKEVFSLLSFDGGDQGWALIGSGSKTEPVKVKGEVLLTTLSQYKDWGNKIRDIGFLAAITEVIITITQSNAHHCNRVAMPAIEGAEIPSVLACADCGRPMEKFILYRCCTG